MRNKFITLSAALAATLALTACNPSGPAAKKKTTESQKAKRAADSIQFTENAEIENIKKRLQLTSQPGLLGFIAVVNMAGAPVYYTCVKGKLTSGGKRLTPQVQQWKIDRGERMGTQLGPAPSDEGTWGSSSPYIYWWTCNGAYLQTNVDYIYSDKPFRLTQKPMIAIDPETMKAEKELSKPQE